MYSPLFNTNHMLPPKTCAGIFYFLLMAGMASSACGQQVSSPRPGPAGSWRHIGTTTVAFKTDRDVIWVTGADAFRKLKFKVLDAPINLLDMKVYFENGQFQDIPLRFTIEKGGESRIIDLNGNVRRLKKIEFWYRTIVPGFKGLAKLMLFGIK